MTDPLQTRVGDWHRARFPDAQMFHVTLKAVEEIGEVAEAVNGVLGSRTMTTAGRCSVLEEAADVVITMLVLCDRWVGLDLFRRGRGEVDQAQ